MAYAALGRSIESSKLFKCNDLSKFVDSIVTHLALSGVSRATLFVCEYAGVQFLTKMVPYIKYPDMLPDENTMYPADTEIEILRIFREELIKKNITPCIIELIYHKTCTGISKHLKPWTKCEKILSDPAFKSINHLVDYILCEYKDHIDNKVSYDVLSFLVLEKCDMSIEAFFAREPFTPAGLAIIKSILFHILYTLLVIRRMFPKFRHCDLHSNNVMLKFDPYYKFSAHNVKYFVYVIDGVEYSVPYFGIIPKIIDFGFSILPERGIISAAVKNNPLVKYETYDNEFIHLMGALYATAERHNMTNSAELDKLFRQLDPNRFYAVRAAALIRNNKNVPTYEDMIKSELWDEYRTISPTKQQIYSRFTAVAE